MPVLRGGALMPGWAMYETATWEDRPFLALSADARLLFIWTWTNPTATICGLYPATLEEMAVALPGVAEGPLTGEVIDRLDMALMELAVKPLVAYDYDNQVVWVLTRAAKANRSPKVLVKMQREYAAVPWSPLKDQFAARYPAIANGGGA